MRVAALCLLLVAGLVIASPARPAAAADPVLKAELVAFPDWLGPNNDLQATFRVTNNGSTRLSGIQVHVEGFDGPGSRSDLADQLAGGRLTQEKWSDTQYPAGPPLAPGETRLITFDHQAPMSSIGFFRTVAPDRADHAYPLRFTVGAGGFTTAAIDTHLLYFVEPQGVDHPLGLSVVIPLDTATVFDSQNREVSRSLESAIAEGGRISRILSALEDPKHAEVAVTLAPTGKLIDSLANMVSANGFTRLTPSGTQQVPANDPAAQTALGTLARLNRLAARPGVRLIASPYAGASLPGLAANGLDKDVRAQVEAGRTQVKSTLGFDPMPGWLLPTDGLLDDRSLGMVAGLGVQNVVLSPSSLQQKTPPLLTPGAQAVVKGRSWDGSVGALVADSALGSRLQGDAGLSPVQVRQRFFAESAALFLERPAQSRAAAVVAPPDWDPDAVVINGILDALTPNTGSPWLTGVAPDSAISQVTNAPLRTVSQSVSDAGPVTPGKDYFDALKAAHGRLDDFAALGPPKDRVDSLSRRLLVAESGEWWGRGSAPDRGKAIARSVSDALRAEFAKIRIQSSNQTITLTDRQAAIPLVLESGVSYPVQVVVHLESDKVAFPGGQACPDLPPAQATCLTKTLYPRAQTIQVKAKAKLSGRFAVRVELRTPPGVLISRGNLFISSTAYNLVALSIMGAAALFILLSWAGGIARRRVGGLSAGAPVD